MAVTDIAKCALRLIFQDYRINVVFAGERDGAALPLPDGVTIRPMIDGDIAALEHSTTDKVRGAVSYARAGHHGYVLTDRAGIQCVAHFVVPEGYDLASIWPLQSDELCLVNIATEAAALGKGYAPMVISHATKALTAQGTRRITAFIWWSNTPSRRAFAKASWRMIGRSIEVKVFGHWLSFRWRTRQ